MPKTTITGNVYNPETKGFEVREKSLIDPQVLGAYLDVKLIDAIKLSPLVNVDNTLVGQPGSTITLPSYEYIKEAKVVGEGEPMEVVELKDQEESVTIKKAGKAVSISDEAMLSAYGDPVNEIGNQLLLAMADRIETDLYAEMAKATLTYDKKEEKFKDDIADALVKFGEDIDGEMYLFIAPAQFAELRKDPDFVHVDNGVITGARGMIHGCTVVVSNRLKDANAAYIMKPGALALVMKRNVMVEADRDILKGMNVYACNEHYAVQLRYEDKVIKINIA